MELLVYIIGFLILAPIIHFYYEKKRKPFLDEAGKLKKRYENMRPPYYIRSKINNLDIMAKLISPTFFILTTAFWPIAIPILIVYKLLKYWVLGLSQKLEDFDNRPKTDKGVFIESKHLEKNEQ